MQLLVEDRPTLHRISFGRDRYVPKTIEGKRAKEEMLVERAGLNATLARKRKRASWSMWAARNKEHLRVRARLRSERRRKQQPEVFRIANQKYYQRNRERILKQTIAYKRNIRRTNPTERLLNALRCRLWGALKAKGVRKCRRTVELLGCSIEQFKQHLESKFRDGMTWDNYGSFWHMDHIIPCAAFDLSQESQQNECFHFSNIQPLLAWENQRKHCKRNSIAAAL